MHASANIAQELIDRSSDNHDLTPMKLLKLVYIAHGWMLALYNQELIAEDVHAWKYGPVIPELYEKIKTYRNNPVTEIPGSRAVNLTSDEDNILNETLEKYGEFSAIKLSSMTHMKGTPWYITQKKNPYGVIPDQDIRNYYLDLLNDQ